MTVIVLAWELVSGRVDQATEVRYDFVQLGFQLIPVLLGVSFQLRPIGFARSGNDQ